MSSDSATTATAISIVTTITDVSPNSRHASPYHCVVNASGSQ